jgi:hypothetical protein
MQDGVVLGKTAAGEDVVLTYEQRRQDTYVIGVNGTGKTTLLREIAYSDMRQDPKHGLCVIDPHGDLIRDIITMVPEERVDDVILFDPSDEDFPFCLNLFAPVPEPKEIGRVASEIVAIFRKIFGAGWTPEVEGVLQNVTLTLLSRPADFPSKENPWVPAMDEIPALLAMERVPEEDLQKAPWKRRPQTYRSQFYNLLQQRDQIPVWEFWTYSFDPLTPRPRSELTFAVLNQVRRFLANPAVRNIVAQTQSKLDLSKVMSEGKILLVNLSKGKLGEANSAFLGSVIVAKLVVAVFAQANQPPESRRPFHIIADEFQNFAISSFPMLLSEARKYNVDLTIAHQYRDQLRDWVQGATVNAANLACFRLGSDDALELARGFDATPPRDEPEMHPVYAEIDNTFDDIANETGTAIEKRLLEWKEGYGRDLVASAPNSLDPLAKYFREGSRHIFAWLQSVATGQPVDFGTPTDTSVFCTRWVTHARAMPDVKAWCDEVHERLGCRWVDATVEQLHECLVENRPSESVLESLHRTIATFHAVARRPENRRYIHHERHGDREYVAAPGRPRLYSDVYQQIANDLTHLPNFQARCRLSGSDAPPIEATFRTHEWPEGYQDSRERAARCEKNVETIRRNTRRDFTEPREKVVKEFRKRYEAMLASIGIEWTPDEPLPTPEILYEEDD